MVVVAAHGRPLLEDQGIHTYTPKLPEFRTLCDYNYGHNAVIVDGRSQPIREETAADLISSQVFDSLDFLAELTQHIPDKGEHLVRYFGWYS